MTDTPRLPEIAQVRHSSFPRRLEHREHPVICHNKATDLTIRPEELYHCAPTDVSRSVTVTDTPRLPEITIKRQI